jgi:hypothetical protein
MASNYDFRFLSVRPNAGWTSRTISNPVVNTTPRSVVGPVNAAAQTQVTADQLRTTPSTLYDTSLGSRQYMNPNTGVRDPVAASSVYAQSDVPAFLSQSVASLNAEQSLRRALAAEWQNRLLRGVSENEGGNAYLFAEALRAASVGPGSSVAFGEQIADPNIGLGYRQQADAAAQLAGAKTSFLGQQNRDLGQLNLLQQKQIQDARSAGGGMMTYNNLMGRTAAQTQALSNVVALRQPTANAIGGAGSGWAPRSGAGYW